MSAARWRIMRLGLIEVALLDSEMNRPASLNDPEPKPTDPGHQIAAAFRRLIDGSRALSFISRYESRLHRIHERSHRTLRELQQSRKEQASEPVPSPAPVQPEPPPASVGEPECGNAIPCPKSQTPSLRSIKKLRNEPKRPRKHVQRRAIAGHRGIMSYIRSQGFRCLRQVKAA